MTPEMLWPLLKEDGVHDPKSPALKIKQEPREALSRLPPDNVGNNVNWIQAARSGQINPRHSLKPNPKIEILDQDILLNLKGGMPLVRFPHKTHTEWLACDNCHDKIFKAETGANKLSMLLILEGQQCGVCHGAVAFPLTECERCHNTPRTGQAPIKPGERPALPGGLVLPGR